jgi:hypothetical protein
VTRRTKFSRSFSSFQRRGSRDVEGKERMKTCSNVQGNPQGKSSSITFPSSRFLPPVIESSKGLVSEGAVKQES